MTIRLHPDVATMRRLALVAQGREEADVVLAGGALVNVFTEELLEGWGVAISGDRVALVGPDADVLARAGQRTWTVELNGDLVAPGLVEGHTHLTRMTLGEMIPRQVAAGVTTTIVESMELGYVAGPGGVRELLAEAETVPGRAFFTVSGLIAIDADQEARVAPSEEWAALLDHPLVAGLGEIYWADLLRGHPRTDALIAAALDRGLPVEGHGAGARLPALAALAAMGVSGDHEGINAEDLRLRLRLGLWGLMRHGATRQDLHAIAALWQVDPPALGRAALVTDGVEPDVLVRGDSLNAVVEEAVELGLPLPRAVALASLHVAERFGLGRWLGGLAPGALGDLMVLPRGGGVRPRLVLVGGAEPAPRGRHAFPAWLTDTIRAGAVAPELLVHPGPGRWRAMRYDAPLVTREAETDGTEALPVIAVDRLGSERAFRGLALGLGITGGGVALSSAWESPSVILAGDRPQDLALALARLHELRGGAVVVRDGRVLAEWRAEVGGLYTAAPAAQVVSEVTGVNTALRDLGCPMPNPLLSLETLTTAAIPFLRISAGGYVRLTDGARLGLEVVE